MQTTYRDAWLKQQFYKDPDRFTVETPPDPGHGDTSELPNAIVMQQAPIAPGEGLIFSDIAWENSTHLTQPNPIDTTPIDGQGTPVDRGHGYGGIFRPEEAPKYGRGPLGAVRGRNLGAPRKQTGQLGRPYRFFNEKWFATLTQGYEPPPITEGTGDPELRRGLNAYPENDGDGGRTRGNGTNSWRVNIPSWKRGTYQGSNIQRDFTPPNRTHTNARMVRPDIVTIVGDSPPPPKSDKYSSPFTALQKFLPKRRRVSGLRKAPGPWDEAIVSTSPQPISPTPIDGLVVF
jgi:hypothetical protein